MRDRIREEVALIQYSDDTELEYIQDVVNWIDSGAELWRTAKPATPPKHLIAYFVVVDGDNVLLVDHKNAKRWLPTGGHVEPGEHPRETVARELEEELGICLGHELSAPLMVTCIDTVGVTAGHTDVCLWYVVNADRRQELTWDRDEFNAVRWFSFAEARKLESDPHLARCLTKISPARTSLLKQR